MLESTTVIIILLIILWVIDKENRVQQAFAAMVGWIIELFEPLCMAIYKYVLVPLFYAVVIIPILSFVHVLGMLLATPPLIFALITFNKNLLVKVVPFFTPFKKNEEGKWIYFSALIDFNEALEERNRVIVAKKLEEKKAKEEGAI